MAFSILLAEDTAFFRRLITSYLTADGYNVTPVEDGQEAWELLQGEEHFDMLVSDIEMPRMDGFELIEKVRASSRWSNLPAISISALHTEEAAKHALASGFDLHEIKIDRERLLTVLAQNFDRRGRLIRMAEGQNGRNRPSMWPSNWYRLFGIPIDCVREINRELVWTPVAHTTDAVAGLINIRGQIQMVVDLAVILGFESSEERKGKRRLVILEDHVASGYGLLVDGVEDIIEMDQAALREDPPAILQTIRSLPVPTKWIVNC